VQDADGRPVRLFELFNGPHATRLVFGHAAFEPGRHVHRILAAGENAVEGEFVDTDGNAFKGYDVTGEASVLVRPDGYVWTFVRP
jgi:hypothetical protein